MGGLNNEEKFSNDIPQPISIITGYLETIRKNIVKKYNFDKLFESIFTSKLQPLNKTCMYNSSFGIKNDFLPSWKFQHEKLFSMKISPN